MVVLLAMLKTGWNALVSLQRKKYPLIQPSSARSSEKSVAERIKSNSSLTAKGWCAIEFMEKTPVGQVINNECAACLSFTASLHAHGVKNCSSNNTHHRFPAGLIIYP